MTKAAILVVAALGVLLGSTGAAAQGLADVARREKARREAIPDDSKARVYTNEDLRGGGRLTTGSSRPQPDGEPGTADTPDAPPDQAGEDTGGDAGTPQTEEQWRSRIAAAREARARAELMAAALQNRADGLWAQFTATDDPAQRAVVEEQRLEALTELEALQQETDRLAEEIREIEEDARRAGVPPGWLR